jgi:hypothetical protein
MNRPYISMTETELLREIWDTRENVKYAVASLERLAGASSFVKYRRHAECLRYSKYLKHLEYEYMCRED